MSRYLSIIFCLIFIAIQFQVLGQQTSTSTKAAKSTEVYFDFGKHDLRPEADSSLAQIINFTRSKTGYSIKITAHTDSIGSLANNMALSQRRAMSVKEYLVNHGIAPNDVSFAFFGETMPVMGNQTEDGRQHNRRATVEVLFKTPAVTIEGVVTDEKTGLPLVADVIVRSKERSDTLRTGSDGRFKSEQVAGTVVGIDAYAPCHFMHSEMVKAAANLPPVSLPLSPATTGAIADIGNLYFVGDQPVLLEKSKPELPKLLRFLQQNPSMKIEIAGHVNLPNRAPVPKTAWEYKLSEARARTVYDYLIDNGITAERVSWKGYGNHEMRFPHATTEAEQALNRRVEMRVLEGGCD